MPNLFLFAALTYDGHAEDEGDGARALDESPVSCKVADARALEDEGGEAEVESADAGAVHPGEEQVAVVALHGGQRQQAQGCGYK